MKTDWNGKRVLILGIARQGQAAARYFTRHGAQVTLNDRRNASELEAVHSALADTPVTWVLGSHPVELLDSTDVVCLSGGVPLNNPIVVEALRRGIPLTNDTQVFMEAVPCKTIGITGSAGKTTTTTLVGRIAKAALGDQAHVGGNIGDPLLNYVDTMKPTDLAILEISSFQLEQMTFSPNVAAILNITPNHLDRHGTMEAYTAAKTRIIQFQKPQDTAILNRDDAGAWGAQHNAPGRLVSFGFSPLAKDQHGTFVRNGIFFLRTVEGETPLLNEKVISLRGDHNRLNTLAACTIASAAGLSPEAMQAGVEGFGGIAHRLEFIREWNEAMWYNDSIATAPERTMADIRSFEEPLVLLLGGRDKDLPWNELVSLVHQRVEHVVLFGEAAGKIAAALDAARPTASRLETIVRCQGLHDAVQSAAEVAEPGDVILLSPGGTSFDEFRDFEERGEWYRKWVSELS
jgi:UDP-N-acetylmuramoylalanine--D-glutamate ligase